MAVTAVTLLERDSERLERDPQQAAITLRYRIDADAAGYDVWTIYSEAVSAGLLPAIGSLHPTSGLGLRQVSIARQEGEAARYWLATLSYTSEFDDLYEPNDDRYTNPWGPLVSGQSYQAKICTATDEDYYYFDVTTTDPVQLHLQLPSSLVNHVSIWLYAQSNLSTPICGTGPVPTANYNETCPISHAGRYIVRLYTDGASDNTNPYTLRVTFD